MKETLAASTPASPNANETEPIVVASENQATPAEAPAPPVPPLADPVNLCDRLIDYAQDLRHVKEMELPTSYEPIKERGEEIARSLKSLKEQFSHAVREHAATLRALIADGEETERGNGEYYYWKYDDSISEFGDILEELDKELKPLGIEIPDRTE